MHIISNIETPSLLKDPDGKQLFKVFKDKRLTMVCFQQAQLEVIIPYEWQEKKIHFVSISFKKRCCTGFFSIFWSTTRAFILKV